ncbi:MAG: ribosome maturation factor RimM [Chitinophagaceae bacterium]
MGKLVAAFGLKGELILQHQLGKKTSLKNLEMLFLEENKNSFIPYFLVSSKIKNEAEIYILLEGIDTREKAQTLIHRNVFLKEDSFKKFAALTAPISLLDMQVEDVHLGDLGKIIEILELPSQVLAKIYYQEKEILLPINESTLRSIDRKNKIVHLLLPEGILQIF